jgi:hypothetical protein
MFSNSQLSCRWINKKVTLITRMCEMVEKGISDVERDEMCKKTFDV